MTWFYSGIKQSFLYSTCAIIKVSETGYKFPRIETITRRVYTLDETETKARLYDYRGSAILGDIGTDGSRLDGWYWRRLAASAVS